MSKKIGIFTRIKAIFNKKMEEFDKNNPEIKIDSLLAQNIQSINKAKDELTKVRAEKKRHERDLEYHKSLLNKYVAELKKAKEEGKNLKTYAMKVSGQEKMVEKLKSLIEKCDTMYYKGIKDIQKAEDKNDEIKNAKTILLTQLQLSKLQNNEELSDISFVDSNQIFEEIQSLIDEEDSKHELKQDLKRDTDVSDEDKSEYMSEETINDVIDRYCK